LAPRFSRLALPVAEQLSNALRDFNCLGAAHADDPVAENVNGFLADGRFEPGIRHGISATYLLLDPEATPQLLGYATLTFDSVRLTNSEKRQMEDLAGIAEFGALRIQMIGVDHRCQKCGHGGILLEGITGLARKLSADVAVRFLLADANIRKVGWYEGAGFVANKAEKERDRINPERSVSMRLDLLEGLRGHQADQTPAVEAATR
jgi:ribosomal protein S18 acetylase RimI-like enzyme